MGMSHQQTDKVHSLKEYCFPSLSWLENSAGCSFFGLRIPFCVSLLGIVHAQVETWHAAEPNKLVVMTECCSCMTQRGVDADMPGDDVDNLHNNNTECLQQQVRQATVALVVMVRLLVLLLFALSRAIGFHSGCRVRFPVICWWNVHLDLARLVRIAWPCAFLRCSIVTL